jgi:hypothetical protein
MHGVGRIAGNVIHNSACSDLAKKIWKRRVNPLGSSRAQRRMEGERCHRESCRRGSPLCESQFPERNPRMCPFLFRRFADWMVTCKGTGNPGIGIEGKTTLARRIGIGSGCGGSPDMAGRPAGIGDEQIYGRTRMHKTMFRSVSCLHRDPYCYTRSHFT